MSCIYDGLIFISFLRQNTAVPGLIVEQTTESELWSSLEIVVNDLFGWRDLL